MTDSIEFVNTLQTRVEELNLKLNDLREADTLINEIHTLKCVSGHLFNLKPSADEI